MIEEVVVIQGRRTTTKRRRAISGQACALCGSKEDLISVSAGARLVRVDPLELCERLGLSVGSHSEVLRPETLICLDCLLGLPMLPAGARS